MNKKIMNDKINIPSAGLRNVASLVSPEKKAIVYTVATIFLYCLIITSAILALLLGNEYIEVDNHKIIHITIGILTIFKGVCLTVQQAFNGQNIKELKKIKEKKKNEQNIKNDN